MWFHVLAQSQRKRGLIRGKNAQKSACCAPPRTAGCPHGIGPRPWGGSGPNGTRPGNAGRRLASAMVVVRLYVLKRPKLVSPRFSCTSRRPADRSAGSRHVTAEDCTSIASVVVQRGERVEATLPRRCPGKPRMSPVIIRVRLYRPPREQSSASHIRLCTKIRCSSSRFVLRRRVCRACS